MGLINENDNNSFYSPFIENYDPNSNRYQDGLESINSGIRHLI